MRLIFLLFSLIPLSLLSQEYNRMYYNSDWIGTSIDSAKFYRISGFNSKIGAFEDSVIDYNVQNDLIEMTGYYVNGKKNGNFKFYYPNGKLKRDISYKDNERIETWTEFYQNGTIKVELKYEHGSEQIIELNDSLGNSLITEGKFKYHMNILNNSNSFFLFKKNLYNQNLEDSYINDALIEGEVSNYKRHGKWKIFKNEELFAKLEYNEGKFKKGYYIVNENKVKIAKIDDNYSSFSLINNPIKFQKTESFMLEPGAKIKSNYVLEGLVEYKYLKKDKITIRSNNEFDQYIKENFSLLSVSNLTRISIEIKIKNGKPIGFNIEPLVSQEIRKEFQLLLGTIEQFDYDTGDILKIEYQFK